MRSPWWTRTGHRGAGTSSIAAAAAKGHGIGLALARASLRRKAGDCSSGGTKPVLRARPAGTGAEADERKAARANPCRPPDAREPACIVRESGDDMDELQSRLDDNWDPDLTVGEWWERLGMSGWAPPAAAGVVRPRMSAAMRSTCSRRLRSTAPAHPWASADARRADDRHSRHAQTSTTSPTLSPGAAWCQLFSEPGAVGSRRPPTQPCETATCGMSTVRRCGRLAASSRTSACCSPARTRRAEASRHHVVRSTCTRPVSKCGRCGR